MLLVEDTNIMTGYMIDLSTSSLSLVYHHYRTNTIMVRMYMLVNNMYM